MTTPAFRPASLDDAAVAADMMTAAYPPEPQDPVVIRYRWMHPRLGWSTGRFIAELDARPIAYVGWFHGPWASLPERQGYVECALDRARWTTALATLLWDWITQQATADGALLINASAVDDQTKELEVLRSLGFRIDRRDQAWELDLITHGPSLVADAHAARDKMREAGIRLTTLASWNDPAALAKLHALHDLTIQDAPHTIPILAQTLEDYTARMNAPDVPGERVWIALSGDRPVAISFLRFPPVRGQVWTGYTGCHPAFRGRGIARGVKLQSLAQAAEMKVPLVRTDNDSENAPMLHINEALGYRRRPGFVSLVKRVKGPADRSHL